MKPPFASKTATKLSVLTCSKRCFVVLLFLLFYYYLFTKFSRIAPELPLLWRWCKQEVQVWDVLLKFKDNSSKYRSEESTDILCTLMVFPTVGRDCPAAPQAEVVQPWDCLSMVSIEQCRRPPMNLSLLFKSPLSARNGPTISQKWSCIKQILKEIDIQVSCTQDAVSLSIKKMETESFSRLSVWEHGSVV